MTRADSAAKLRPEARIRLLGSRLIRGQNIYHERTVFVQSVEFDRLANRRSVEFGPEFPGALSRRFGNLDAEFLTRLLGADGVSLERVLLESIMALERSVACTMQRLDPVTFSVAKPGERHGVVDLVWECHEMQLSRAAARAALLGVRESIEQPSAPPSHAFKRRVSLLRRRAARLYWPAPMAALIQRARRREIAYEPMANAYLRLGEGAMQQVVSAASVASGSVAFEHMFPPDAPSALPTALIVGQRGKEALGRKLDALLRTMGVTAALVTRLGATVGGQSLERSSRGLPGEVRSVLRDPRVEALVHTVSPARIARRGLRINRCRTTAVLDLGEEAEALKSGVEVAIRAAEGLVVIATDHPLAPSLASARDASGLMLVASLPRDLAAHRHLADGGWATLLHSTPEGDELRIQHGDEVVARLSLADHAPADRYDGARLRTLMYAMALAHSMGLPGGDVATAAARLLHLGRGVR